MFPAELLWILFLAAIIWFWLDSMRTNEIARSIGRQVCKQSEVLFLDDSVVMQKIRLRRNANGQVTIYREYQFEFTSDGSQRYKGKIALLGKQLSAVELDAHRIPQEYTYH